MPLDFVIALHRGNLTAFEEEVSALAVGASCMAGVSLVDVGQQRVVVEAMGVLCPFFGPFMGLPGRELSAKGQARRISRVPGVMQLFENERMEVLF